MPVAKAKQLANMATCAALYTVAIAITAFVPTPWGVGQFRPGVVIPVIYAFLGGSLVAGVGAAVGTLLGSFILQAAGTGLGPFGSLVSGVPANFIGFYLLGMFVSKYKSWKGFIFGSFVSLMIGNLVAAGGVALYLTYVFPRWASMVLEVKLGAILGLTLFWTVTMLPFVLALVPIVIVALSRTGFSSMESFSYFRSASMKDVAVPSVSVAVILGAIYALIVTTSVGTLMFASVVSEQNIFWVKSLFAFSSVIMIGFALVGVLLVSKSYHKSSSS
jgi:hypothetical protein